jgi:hypothetical protein
MLALIPEEFLSAGCEATAIAKRLRERLLRSWVLIAIKKIDVPLVSLYSDTNGTFIRGKGRGDARDFSGGPRGEGRTGPIPSSSLVP